METSRSSRSWSSAPTPSRFRTWPAERELLFISPTVALRLCPGSESRTNANPRPHAGDLHGAGHAGAHAECGGGRLIGTPSQWERFDKRLAKLQRRHGFSTFRSTELKCRRGDFCRWTDGLTRSIASSQTAKKPTNLAEQFQLQTWVGGALGGRSHFLLFQYLTGMGKEFKCTLRLLLSARCQSENRSAARCLLRSTGSVEAEIELNRGARERPAKNKAVRPDATPSREF